MNCDRSELLVQCIAGQILGSYRRYQVSPDAKGLHWKVIGVAVGVLVLVIVAKEASYCMLHGSYNTLKGKSPVFLGPPLAEDELQSLMVFVLLLNGDMKAPHVAFMV